MTAEQRVREADVCLILEGTYPYVAGGVSGWTHGLITAQSDFSFHILSIVPDDMELEPCYVFPPNVTGHTVVRLNAMPRGSWRTQAFDRAVAPRLLPPLRRLMDRADLSTLQEMIELLRQVPFAGSRQLLDGETAWEGVTALYEERYAESSFLDFFWAWRILISGLYSILLAPLPRARAYHTLCTGYAGLMAARARLETGRPAILTEHGLYTNERRIEIAAAAWLEKTASTILSIERTRWSLRDLLNAVFANYARIAYEACAPIIALYQANQAVQLAEGADPARVRVVPNGIDVARFAALPRVATEAPVIGFIGRVVPIKDVATFLRACALLRARFPGFTAFVAGPDEEDPAYSRACRSLCAQLGLEDVVTFTGKIDVAPCYAKASLVVLTSLSEAQPLVILEAGACGVPVVATDVGSCRELLEGRADETPRLGPGGIVTPLANPEATATAMATLLEDPEKRTCMGEALHARVARYYDLSLQQEAYHALYAKAVRGGE